MSAPLGAIVDGVDVRRLGEAEFADIRALAYAELSEGLRRALDGPRAVHSAEGLAGRYGADPGQAPRRTHRLQVARPVPA